MIPDSGGNNGGFLKWTIPSVGTSSFLFPPDNPVLNENGNFIQRVSGTTGEHDSTGNTNDPIDTFTGELFKQFSPDLFLGGPMPIHFSRYYASGLKQSGVGRVMIDLRVMEQSGTALGETEFIRISGPGGSAYVNIDTADFDRLEDDNHTSVCEEISKQPGYFKIITTRVSGDSPYDHIVSFYDKAKEIPVIMNYYSKKIEEFEKHLKKIK